MANKPSPDATALTVKDPLRAGAVMWLTSAPSVWLVHFSRAGQQEVYLLTIMLIFPMQLHCKY